MSLPSKSPILIRVLIGAAAALLTAPLSAAPTDLSVSGYLAGRALETEGQASWLDGGFGRLAAGGGDPGDSGSFAQGQLHVTLDYQPSSRFGVFVHGLARAEPDVAEGQAVGVVEAFVHGSIPLRSSDRLHLRLGHFFLPTSRENVEVGWSSPYTLTFSALNTWISEDVRPTGFLAEYRLATGAVDELRFGSSVFGGNDSSGALLAWRGWSMTDRLGTYGEVVPLPPIDSLGPGGAFKRQLNRGTRPFGDDLDSRLGYAAWASYVRPQKASVQWTRYDNRGDRRLYNHEYAWTTRFDLLGFDVHFNPSWSFAGEHISGSTGMGRLSSTHVQLDMAASYLLVSYQPGPFRLTLRYDRFEMEDRDLSGADDNNEDGEAWTLAFFWEGAGNLRVGAELLDLDADRPEAAASGFEANTDATSLSLEVRYYF